MSINTYKIEPKRNKSSFSIDYWKKEINGKNVTLTHTIMWRSCSFYLNLTEEDKNKLEKEETVIISDYNYDYDEMYDPCDRFVEVNQAISNVEIYRTDEEIYDEDFLEEKGWFLEDTVYKINYGVNFTKK